LSGESESSGNGPIPAEPDRPQGAPSRLALTLVVAPLVVMVAAGYVADAFWADLVNSNPLLLLMLSARNRYAILVVNQLDPAVYYTVGTIRLLLPDPLFYLLGFWYGDAAVRWMESRTATYGQMLRRLEVMFRKWGHPLVFVFPNNPICLFAGAARMPVPIFAALNVAGTITRLVLIALVGEAFQDPIDAVLGFVADYRIPILIASVVIVGFTVWSETRQGTSEIDQLRRIEHELDDGDGGDGGDAGRSDPSTVDRSSDDLP
jgi:membrane protein DedA with SNARE-associated domain